MRNESVKSVVCAMAVAVVLSVLVGCGRNDKDLTFAEMKSEDIIVQVNDNILRKSELERFYRMNMAYLSTLKGNERQEAMGRIRNDMVAYAPTFVEQMLMVDDAKRHHVLTDEQLAAEVEAYIEKAAKAKKLTKDEFLSQFPDSAWFARKTAEVRVLVNTHVASNIPPVAVVTPAIVSNYVREVNAEYDAVLATNAWKKATLESIRKRVIAGKASFTNEAARLSEDDWNLGDLERAEIDFGAELRNQIFSVPGGIVLEPTEDDDCYRLIQVAKVIPGTKDEKGRLLDREKRRVYQIVLTKEDLPVKMGFGEAALELQRQFRSQAVSARLELLKTNGENTVVWPHGQNIWRKRK